MKTDSKILIMAIGNNCRADDGLGWRFVEEIERMGIDFIHYEYRYQLQVEDSALISEYDSVFFVDATYEAYLDGFNIYDCAGDCDCKFSSHAQSPGAIVSLTNNLYKIFPKAYIIAICGEQWGLQTYLSETAERNLQAAVSFFTRHFLPPKLISVSEGNSLSTIT